MPVANITVRRERVLKMDDGGSYKILALRASLMGGGADTYTTGGEALDLRPWLKEIDHVEVIGAEDVIGSAVYQIDDTNFPTGQCTVIATRQGVHTHALHLNEGDQADGAGTRVNAAANRLGANTGADIAVAGVVDTTGVGGIVQAAQSALAQVTAAVDLSTTIIRILAMGVHY